jgi:hypothetical protein
VNATLDLYVDDLTYTVKIASFHAGTAEYMDTGEVDLAPFATVEFASGATDVVTYGTVVLAVAADAGISLSAAERKIEDEAFRAAYEHARDQADDYDDCGADS